MFRRRRRRLLERPTFRLQFDELSGDVVTTSLREDPQNGPAGLVEVYTAGQRTPQRAAGPFDHVPHLKHGQTDDPVFTGEAIVTYTEMKFVAVRVGFASQWTVEHTHTTRMTLTYDTMRAVPD